MMESMTKNVRMSRVVGAAAIMAAVCAVSVPATAQSDAEWAERVPPSLGFMWSFVPADMPQICQHFRSMPRGGNSYVGTSLPPGTSKKTFLTRVLRSRAPDVFNYGCKASPTPSETPDLSLVDTQRRVVVMESTLLQDKVVDAYHLATLEIPQVDHVRGRAIRVSYPSDDPDALEASFDALCSRGEAPRYCTYIARTQVRGARLEVDLVYNRSSLERVSGDPLADAGWDVDVTSEPFSQHQTSAAQAFTNAESGLAVYARADDWLRHRLAEQITHAVDVTQRDEPLRYSSRARQVLSLVYERALMDASEREVHSQALLATADAEALEVDAVQTLTEYGSQLTVEGRGRIPAPQRGPGVAIAGEFAIDFSSLAKLIRPARWLTEPFERRPRDPHVAMLLKKIDEHSRKFYLARGDYNPLFGRLNNRRTGPPDETWFTMFFQPVSTLAGALQVNRSEPVEAASSAGIRGLSFELGLALYREVPFDLELVVESDAGEAVLQALKPFASWSFDSEPEYLQRAKLSVDSGRTRLAVGDPADADAQSLADAELARVSLNFERAKAQFEVMRNAGARSGELAKIAPYVASVLCPNPHKEHGCLLFDRRMNVGNGRQSGLALYFALENRRNMALSVTADAKTRVFRLVYGRDEVEPPSVPASPAEPVSASGVAPCEADAMWAAADMMSRDMLGMYELVDVLEMGRGRRSQLLMGRGLRRQVVEFSVEDMEKAQAKYLEKRRDVLVGQLDAIRTRCEGDSASATWVGEALDFWKSWSPTHEHVGYEK